MIGLTLLFLNGLGFFCLPVIRKLSPFLKDDQQKFSETHLKDTWLGLDTMAAYKIIPAHSQPYCLMALKI